MKLEVSQTSMEVLSRTMLSLASVPANRTASFFITSGQLPISNEVLREDTYLEVDNYEDYEDSGKEV